MTAKITDVESKCDNGLIRPRRVCFVALAMVLCLSTIANASPSDQEVVKKSWYDRLTIRGYLQFRYNRLGKNIDDLAGRDWVDNDKLLNPSQDKSLGPNGGFFFRRARLILFGDVHEQVYFYFQTDAASAVSDDKQHFVQIRDLYADIALDSTKEFRFRFGQSKVPYGFENLQSSQNRIPMDRTDAINSAVPGERDLGTFFYWAPSVVRARFKHLIDAGLKGSGDYGVLGLGVYNGQTANVKEFNGNLHAVARVTYPLELGSQIIEPGFGGYYGTFRANPADPKVVTAIPTNVVVDIRLLAQLVWYPRPIGFQTEVNWGKGPSQTIVLDAHGKETSVFDAKNTFGGYVMLLAKIDTIYPYARFQWYRGGRKDVDVPYMETQEVETGVEW